MSQTRHSTDSNSRAGARRGEQVLERLRENPPTIWYRGEQVRDVTAHPALRGGVDDPRAALRSAVGARGQDAVRFAVERTQGGALIHVAEDP